MQIFFFSYAVFEVPSNVFLKRLRPSIWLSLLMLLWGIMMARIFSSLERQKADLSIRRYRVWYTIMVVCWVSHDNTRRTFPSDQILRHEVDAWSV